MSGYRVLFPTAFDAQPDPAQVVVSLSVMHYRWVLVTDPTSKCLYSNKVYRQLCGWSTDEVIGSLWSAVIHPQDQDKSVHRWKAALQDLEPFMFETRLLCSTSEVIWARRNAALLVESVPDRGYVHTVDDISTYKANEIAWLASEEQLSEEKERAPGHPQLDW